MIAAVGAEQANQTYEKFFRDVYEHWQKDNPNLKLFGAYIHFDETTPHLHLDYLPVGEYKRGMTKKVSRDGALSKYKRGDKYGENKWTQWACDERKQLEMIAGNYAEEIIPHEKFDGKRIETYQWRQQAVEYYLNNLEQPPEPVKPEKKIFESKTDFEKRKQEYKQQQEVTRLWKAGEKIVVGRQDEQEETRRQR